MKLVLAAVLAFGSPVGPVAAPAGEILGAGGAQPIAGSYIVVMKNSVSAKGVAERHGGRVGQVFAKALNGVEVSMPEAAARRLAADPDVAFVQQNGIFTADLGT